MDLCTYLLNFPAQDDTIIVYKVWVVVVSSNQLHAHTQTHTNFQSFYKKTIDLVREWFLRQCTVESRYLKPTRDIEKVQAIGSSSYQELSPKDRKRKKEKRKKGKKGFTIFLISCFYSYSVVHGNIKFNFRFPSVFFFSELVILLFLKERKRRNTRDFPHVAPTDNCRRY